MKGRGVRVLCAAALLVAVIAPTAMLSPVAAARYWDHSCQTVSGSFAYDGAGYSGWGVTIKLTASGCWNSSSTWTTSPTISQQVTRDWHSWGSLAANGIGTGPSSGFTLYWANYLVVANANLCGVICTPYGGIYGLYPRLELHPSSSQSTGAGWRATTFENLVKNQDVSFPYASTPTIQYGAVTQYFGV